MISQDFWEIKRMCKQWIPGSLFPCPLRAWVRGWGNWCYTTSFPTDFKENFSAYVKQKKMCLVILSTMRRPQCWIMRVGRNCWWRRPCKSRYLLRSALTEMEEWKSLVAGYIGVMRKDKGKKWHSPIFDLQWCVSIDTSVVHGYK